MLSRPHPVFGDWCYCQPGDSQRLLDRQLAFRDAALKEDPNFSGMPQAFIDWTWQQWLPSHLHRYEKQVEEHIHYLDQKLGRLNEEIERAAGGILDDRDAAADLRDRLKRELEAREMAS